MAVEPQISVVVPSYNRAHILPLTIPTYLQPEVGELILIDDASTDNTAEVVQRLQKQYPQIRYLRNELNSKQGYTKNRGIQQARYPYIYFGDDDSVLPGGDMAVLLADMQEYNADLVGAKALYMYYAKQWKTLTAFVKKHDTYAKTIEEIVNVQTMYADFSKSVTAPVEVPFTQACFLTRANIAQQTLFDTHYQGNAYREETDFVIRVALAGYKVMYDSRAVQVNLPPTMVRGGGAHTGNTDGWYQSAIENNDYFLSKNYEAMKLKWGLTLSIEQMRTLFRNEMRERWLAEHRRDSLKRIGLYKPLHFIKHLWDK